MPQVEDKGEMNDDTAPTDYPWIPVGLALLVLPLVLVGTALLATGTTRFVSVMLLGILIPTAAIGGGLLVRDRLRRRITGLELDIERERSARQAHDRMYALFTDELRAPLTGVVGLSRHLDHAGIANVAEAEELIGLISHDATEVVQQVENLATAAQIDSGTYRPHPMVLQLDQHVVRIIAAAGHSRMEIATDVQPATVRCDPMAVRQILLNVLRAADGDGATTVRIDVQERNGLGILSITDDRNSDGEQEEGARELLGSGSALLRRIVPALVEQQGATTTTARTLGWTNTVIRFPIATPAQLAMAMGAEPTYPDTSRIV